MAVDQIHRENNIVIVRFEAELTRADATVWFNALQRAIDEQDRSVVALIDATSVSFVSAAARLIIAQTLRLPQITAVLFVSWQPAILQSMRMTGMLGERNRMRLFTSMDEAWYFAREQCNPQAQSGA